MDGWMKDAEEQMFCGQRHMLRYAVRSSAQKSEDACNAKRAESDAALALAKQRKQEARMLSPNAGGEKGGDTEEQQLARAHATTASVEAALCMLRELELAPLRLGVESRGVKASAACDVSAVVSRQPTFLGSLRLWYLGSLCAEVAQHMLLELEVCEWMGV
eukprot:scaffold60666_cov18-Tisochrysis_lutea.AAC.3